MNDPSSQSADPLQFHEQLTAYFDGELDATASQAFERRLAAEPGVQQKLKQLQQTWDLLEQLPRADVDSRFTRSTVEMIAVEAEADASREHALAARSWKIARHAAALLVATAAGFMAVRLLWPGPNEALLRDLPILENLEAYRQTPDVEFLRQLSDSGLFAEEAASDEPTNAAPANGAPMNGEPTNGA